MYRFFITIVAFISAIALVAGCGQKQETKAKVKVIKPMEAATENEDADTEEQETPATAPVSAVSTAASPAPEAIAEKPAVVQATQPSDMLVLADFDSGEKPSNVGGNFGSWNRDPSDPTQWCKETFDNVTRHGEKGFAMKLSYCVDSPNPAYNGFWMMLPNLDASKYDTLNLWVKGDAQAGYSTVFKIELKNAAKQIGRYYVSNVTDQWQQVSIPLSEFKGLLDRTALTEFVIVFEDRMATNKKGVIYVDDISFSKK